MSSETTNRGLLFSSFGKPMSVVELPMPQAETGTAVIKVLATGLAPYTHLIHEGKFPQLNLTLPLVPGPSSIGRVHAVGPDAVALKVGDLVFVDGLVRARDDPTVNIMPGHMSDGRPESQVLMREVWRDGAMQRYQKAPLENCFLLDEKCLFALGYDAAVLHTIGHYTVVAGAILEAAGVKTAETVVIGPSGGSFGGLAVEMALAVGANVVALGRDEERLAMMREKLCHPRLRTVVMTGDDAADAAAIMRATPGGLGADVFNDWTPGELMTPPFVTAALQTLKKGGRVVLSGGATGGCRLPYGPLVIRDIKIMGKWMCERQTIDRVIAMITQGHLRIGKDAGTEIRVFGLEDHEEAIEDARIHGRWRSYTVIAPNAG